MTRKLTCSLAALLVLVNTWCTIPVAMAASCPGFRTQTQGGWGADPSGNNPGTYLHANFAAAFPQGLTVGCTDQLKLTTAQAVTDFLPSGSTASALPAGVLTDPGQTYQNVLAGQVVALTLSVGFDNFDADFSSSSNNLEDLVISTGIFQGWTVQHLLAEANLKLGGCYSPYTFSQLNDAVSSVNENYVDGQVSGDYLDCVPPPPPVISVTGVGHIPCYGGNSGSVNITVTSGLPPYAFLWNTGATTEDLANVPAGSYSVTVTDANGSTATTTVVVNGPAAALSVSINGTNPTCYNAANGSAIASATGGTSPYSYLWSNGRTTAANQNIPAGTYSVTVTDANNCTGVKQITLIAPQPIVAYTNCIAVCPGACNGQATVTVVGGGTPPYTYAWSTGATGEAIGNLCAGIYWVTITDANGCKKIIAAEVATNPAITINGTATNLNCYGICNGSISQTISGGSLPFSYLWSSGQTTKNISGLCIGTYTVTVTDSKGCSATKTYEISQPAALGVVVNPTNPLCYGLTGSASASVNGGTPPYQYLWSNGSITSSASNLPAGAVSVTVTDANGCTATDGDVITVPSQLVITPSHDDVDCFGGSNGSASVSVEGGTPLYTFHWSNNATGSVITNVPAGTYTVTVYDANQCSATATIVIGQAPALGIEVSSTNPLCYGGFGTASASANGGTQPYSYLWSNGATTSSIGNLAAGSYGVTITDANLCTVPGNVVISIPSQLVAIPSTTSVICVGGCNGAASLQVSGGSGAYSYIWSNNATTSSVQNLCAGVYGYTVYDANQCSTSGSVEIAPGQTVTVEATSTNVSCHGGHNGTASASASGGTAPYAYLWSNGKTTAAISNLAPGTYGVTATDANGCTAATSVLITQPAPIVAYANCIHICPEACNSVGTITVTGGTAPYTYAWSNGATGSEVSGLCPGVYWITITDANNCKKIIAATVATYSPVVISGTSSNVTCNGICIGTITQTVTGGGSVNYFFAWSDGATTKNRTNLCAGTYTVTATSAHGCADTAVYIITQPQPLDLDLSSVSPLCYGGIGSASATATGGTQPYSFVWSNGSTGSSISGVPSGTYSVTVTDANLCTASESVVINVPTQLVAGATQTDVACYGGNDGSINLTVSGGTPGYTYLWNDGVTTEDRSGLVAGTYSVTITDAHDCTASASATIHQPVVLAIVTGSTDATCFEACNGSASVAVTGGTAPYSIIWSNNATEDSISGLCAGNYSVTVYDAHQCSATGTVVVEEPVVLSAIPSVTNVLCHGDNTGAVSVNVSGGTMQYQIIWSNGATSFSITGLVAGEYCFTVTDAQGCSVSGCATVGQPELLLVSSICPTLIDCYGNCTGSIDITVYGGTAPFEYLWSNGATTEDVDSLCAGAYSVTVTDAYGCVFVQTHAPFENPEILYANATKTDDTNCLNPVCDGTATVTPAGGTAPYAILWSNGSTEASISGLCKDSTLYVTVTDANGCVAVDSVTIGCQPPPPCVAPVITITGNLAPCTAPDATITLGVGGLENHTALYYIWSTDATDSTIVVSASGNYCVTVAVADSFCLATACAEVIYQPLPVASATSTDVTCFEACDGTATLTVSAVGLYSVNWNDGSTEQNRDSLCAGTYSYTVTSAAGCTVSGSVVIEQPELLTVSADSSNLTCFESEDGTIDLTINGGSMPYSISWSAAVSGAHLTGLAAGTYCYTVTDAHGCAVSGCITLSQPEQLLASSVCDTILCYDACNGAIDVTVYGGTQPYTYLWSNDATTQDLSNLCPGTYTVTITDANNCTFVLTHAPLTNPDLLEASASPWDVTCFEDCDGGATASVTGGTQPYTIVWNTGFSGGEIENLCAGTYSFTVTDANGCTAVAEVTVGTPEQLLASAVCPTGILCPDACTGSIDVTVYGGTSPYVYLWNDGATTQDREGLCAGEYWVTITDANGCTYQLNHVPFASPDSIEVSVESTNTTCFNEWGGSISLTISGGTAPYSIEWNGGYSGADLSDLAAGTYCYTVTDANGCSVTGCVTITEPEPLLASSVCGCHGILCYGECTASIDVTVYGGTAPYTYLWNDGGNTQDRTNLCAGFYMVTITDANGCTYDLAHEPVGQPDSIGVITTSTNAQCNPTVCNGTASVEVTGGVAPYTYVWSGSSVTLSSIGGLCGGDTATVIITDFNGCVANAVIPINCDTLPTPDCEPLRTQTQGGWGSTPNGNNPGVYLHANFDDAFPNGLTIGCDNTLSFTSAQAITNWLPSGSTPSALPAGALVNPNTGGNPDYNNVFAAQLVAATLSVGFDYHDADFGAGDNHLGDMVFVSGTFAGWTVNDVIAEANDAIGGCGSVYSYSDLSGALATVNENYVDGNQDHGNLTCQPAGVSMRSSEESVMNDASALTANAYPNPNEGRFSLSLNAVENGRVNVKMVDVMGRVMMSENRDVVKGTNILNIDLGTIASATYTLIVTDGVNTVNKMISVTK